MSSAVRKALVAARQKCLTEDEAYWDPKPDFTHPVSARNEAAALSWLLDHRDVVCRGCPADVAELVALCADYCSRMGAAVPPEEQSEQPGSQPQRQQQQQQEQQQQQQEEGGQGDAHTEGPGDVPGGPGSGGREGGEATSSGRSFEEASAEAALQRWCVEKGVRGAASPALFGGGGDAAAEDGAPPLRGLRADTAVAPGDVVLHVPSDLLISYEMARESDLGKVLAALPLGLGDDSIALIWTCVERREPESVHRPFWAALPERFPTMLSASEAEVALLEGTPLHGEVVMARKHLRDAFEASSPAFQSLMGAYPDYFKPEWFSWESYLAAAELWYSYGIQVQFAPGDIRTCLAPYLGLMNHHPLPHIVHFSSVDPKTSCLRVRAFRPCAAHCQLFLSYGPYPNAKLLLFYGFALPDNPVDEVDLVLQVPTGPAATDRRALLAAAGLPLEHRLRAGGRLAPSLLACARLLAAPPALLKQLRGLPPTELKARLQQPLEPTQMEQAAMKVLGDAVESLLRPARACAARLRTEPPEARAGEGGGVDGEAADEAADRLQALPLSGAGPISEAAAASTAVRAELRHFAGVYVSGLVRILEESLRTTRGTMAS